MDRVSPHLAPILLILGALLAVYSGCFGHDFLVNWDDPAYVAANPDVQGLTVENIRKVFTSFYVGNYAPMQMLSYMVDHEIWGARPFGFILGNVLLHGLNGMLFYLLLCRLGLQPGWACLSALLFVVHPVQVESVAWISQRKNVLAMTFFLAAFWQYLAYVQTETRKWRHFAASSLCFLLALLTKSVVVVFPAVLLAYDVALREGQVRWRDLLAEKVPFAVLSVGTAWLAMISQRDAIAAQYPGGSIFATAITMLTVYKDYLFNLTWPLQLSAVYLENFKTKIDVEVLLSATLLVATVTTLLLLRRECRRVASFWLALFFLGFVPVSQIVPMMTLMNDRYLYFPLLGFAVYLLLLIKTLAESFGLQPRLVFVLAASCVVLLAPVSWLRAGAWANSLTLWQDAVRKQPQSSWAWSLLGDAYRKSGEIPTAIESYRKAVDIDPEIDDYHYELGKIYQGISDYESAIQSYNNVLALNPGHVDARYNLALTYTATKQHQAVVALLEPVVRSGEVTGSSPLSLLAANQYFQGNLSAAWQVYEQLWERYPGDAGAPAMLALIALRMGEKEVSSRLWRQAVAGGFGPADLYLDWARMEALASRRESALNFIAEALKLGVGNPEALYDDPDFASLKDDAVFFGLVKNKEANVSTFQQFNGSKGYHK